MGRKAQVFSEVVMHEGRTKVLQLNARQRRRLDTAERVDLGATGHRGRCYLRALEAVTAEILGGAAK